MPDTQKIYDRNARWYDMFESPMEWALFSHWRSQLFTKIKGRRLLEVGVGTGKNISLYPENSQVTAVDFSNRMLVFARRRAANLGKSVDIRQMDIRRLRFPDHSFDASIATFVFCSVPDPVAGLREIRRVLRPGGKLHMLEHVRPGNRIAGRLFDLFNPVAVRLSGANINRQTVENVRKAGFLIVRNRSLLTGVFREIIAALYAGSGRHETESETSETDVVDFANAIPEYARAGEWCRGPEGTGIPLPKSKRNSRQKLRGTQPKEYGKSG
ncbi:MAG: methyltransferase domain-containing protein [Chitinivibrionales bacterium]|nr:methyltransferase domain-containing protein [Chitinivibrionales bacterium]MBD3356562.1 methyltransferase domain-containing protein [Chitinivibrionales bacterium]